MHKMKSPRSYSKKIKIKPKVITKMICTILLSKNYLIIIIIFYKHKRIHIFFKGHIDSQGYSEGGIKWTYKYI